MLCILFQNSIYAKETLMPKDLDQNQASREKINTALKALNDLSRKFNREARQQGGAAALAELAQLILAQQQEIDALKKQASAPATGQHAKDREQKAGDEPKTPAPKVSSPATSDDLKDVIHALVYNDVPLLKSLMAQGLDINDRNYTSDTLLMRAIGEHTSMEMMRFLIESGADLTAKNIYGQTALNLAKRAGLPGTAALLEQAAADPDRKFAKAKEIEPTKYLMSAIHWHDLALVKSLLNQGADANVVSEGGFSALSSVALSSYENPMMYTEMARALVAAGASTDPKAPGNKHVDIALHNMAFFLTSEMQKKAITDASKAKGKPLTILMDGAGTGAEGWYGVPTTMFKAAQDLTATGANAHTLMWGGEQLLPVDVTQGQYSDAHVALRWGHEFAPVLDYIKNADPVQQNFVLVSDGNMFGEKTRAFAEDEQKERDTQLDQMINKARDVLANTTATLDVVIIGNRLNEMERFVKSVQTYGNRVTWRILSQDQSVSDTLKEIAIARGVAVPAAKYAPKSVPPKFGK
jgi:hypothetical protein